MDCTLIANEVVDELRKRGSGGILFKIDFEKAYDCISWNFLELCMVKMGFRERWRS